MSYTVSVRKLPEKASKRWQRRTIKLFLVTCLIPILGANLSYLFAPLVFDPISQSRSDPGWNTAMKNYHLLWAVALGVIQVCVGFLCMYFFYREELALQGVLERADSGGRLPSHGVGPHPN